MNSVLKGFQHLSSSFSNNLLTAPVGALYMPWRSIKWALWSPKRRILHNKPNWKPEQIPQYVIDSDKPAPIGEYWKIKLHFILQQLSQTIHYTYLCVYYKTTKSRYVLVMPNAPIEHQALSIFHHHNYYDIDCNILMMAISHSLKALLITRGVTVVETPSTIQSI